MSKKMYDEGARPVDRLARKVVFGQSGDNVAPPEIRPPRGKQALLNPPELRKVPPDMPNFTGHKVGSYTVVGLALQSSSDGARWVLRCVCGYYALSSTKALRNPNPDAKCAWCIRTTIIKEKDAGITRKRAAEAVYRFWKEQPQLRKPTENEKDLAALIGQKAGKMVLVGPLAGEKNKWVMKCDCGTYELRKGHKLKKPKHYFMRCRQCDREEYLKRVDAG